MGCLSPKFAHECGVLARFSCWKIENGWLGWPLPRCTLHIRNDERAAIQCSVRRKKKADKGAE